MSKIKFKIITMVTMIMIVIMMVMAMPLVIHAFQLLSNEMVGMAGVVDSDLWVDSGGADSALLLGFSGAPAPPAATNIGLTILRSVLGIIIALGTCIGTMRLIGDLSIVSAAFLALEGVLVYIIATQLLATII